MDEDAKKTALRMIPYGMYVLTTKSKDGKDVGAATVNWLTQTSFSPPLIAVGIKADSGTHQHIKDTGVFAVNVIGTDQKDMAFTFFKSLERDGNTIGGQEFEDSAETKSPLLLSSPAWWDCKVVGEVAKGDHTLFVGEVVDAGVRREDKTIVMGDHNLFYGG
ncbi:MAG: flavin reductase family protein [Chloroflexi bacterium]|nr:flavin reductase family protein [Chloroflexota bacterium]